MGTGSSRPDKMETGSPTLESSGSKQADSGSNTIDYTAAMSQYKKFLEQLTSQSCAIESSIKTQGATLQHFLIENEKSTKSTTTESDQNLLRQMLYHNQKCMANVGHNMQLIIEQFKTFSQPVIDAYDHQVSTDKDNLPTKNLQHTNQKLQQQHRSEVKSTGRSGSHSPMAEGTTVDNPDRQRGEVAMHRTSEELKREIGDLKQEVKEAKKIEQENIKLNKLLKEQHESLVKVSAENNDLSEQIQTMKKKYRELESKLESETMLLKKKNRELEKRLLQDRQKSTEAGYKSNSSWFSKKPKITVKAQLYCPRKGELASAVVSEMSTMLQTQFNVDNVILDLEAVDQGSSIRPGVPVMVICINASRLGTDVATALQNLTVNKSMSLVVMHHKDIHALPNQTSDRVLTAAEYKQLGGIFDMAFLSGKGIYPCDMNNSTVSAIVGFIKQHNDGAGGIQY